MEDTSKFNFKAVCDNCFGCVKSTISKLRQNKSFMARAPFVTIVVAAAITAGIVLAKSVNVFKIWDGAKYATVYSVTNNSEEAVESLGLEKDDYRILKTNKTARKTNLEIARTFPVTIVSGEEKIEVLAIKSKVGDILAEAGIKVDEFDLIEPAATKVMSKSGVIDYVNVDYVTEQETEVIPYTTKTVFSSTLSSGDSYVTGGTDGLKTVSYKKKLVNGQVAEKTAISEEILTNPVSGVKVVGTANGGRITTGVAVTTSSSTGCYSTLIPASPIPLDENGVPTNYTNHITVQATAYSYTGFRTSTGKNPQPGYVAVNPAYIPYGTKMYIVSSDGNWVYGYAEAADTGGFINSRPTNIDLFFETISQCYAFGRRNIEVYFLP